MTYGSVIIASRECTTERHNGSIRTQPNRVNDEPVLSSNETSSAKRRRPDGHPFDRIADLVAVNNE